MSERVKMTVECLGEICVNCPELKISVDTLTLSSYESEISCNELKCVHLDRCRGIYSMIKDDLEEKHVRKLLTTRLEHSHK